MFIGWELLTGPHPSIVYAVAIANALKAKLKFATVLNSYGWSTRVIDQIASMITNLEVEILAPVACKGFPTDAGLEALTKFAETITEKHPALGLR